MQCSMVAELEGVTDNAPEVVAEAPDPRLLYEAPPNRLQLDTYAKSCGLVDAPMRGGYKPPRPLPGAGLLQPPPRPPLSLSIPKPGVATRVAQRVPRPVWA